MTSVNQSAVSQASLQSKKIQIISQSNQGYSGQGYSGQGYSGQGYSGDVTPLTAWESLQNISNAALVDVRTQAEWVFVGTPELTSLGKELITIELQHYPEMEFNKNFAQSLKKSMAAKQAPLFFLCRSGMRSRNAAIMAKQIGYENTYNIDGGFEGEHNNNRQRGAVNGWKSAGLPWRQG